MVTTLELPSRHCAYVLFSKAGQMAIIPNSVSHGASWVILQGILELSFVYITSGTWKFPCLKYRRHEHDVSFAIERKMCTSQSTSFILCPVLCFSPPQSVFFLSVLHHSETSQHPGNTEAGQTSLKPPHFCQCVYLFSFPLLPPWPSSHL